jgi:hypothetical protein
MVVFSAREEHFTICLFDFYRGMPPAFPVFYVSLISMF